MTTDEAIVSIAETLLSIVARMEVMERTLEDIKESTYSLPTDASVRQAAAESIEYSLFELNQMMRDIELNRGREELRAARAAKAAS